jgi:hypothetical protein
MEVMYGNLLEKDPEFFSKNGCALTSLFRKAGRWLRGYDFNETPAPQKGPSRNNGPA